MLDMLVCCLWANIKMVFLQVVVEAFDIHLEKDITIHHGNTILQEHMLVSVLLFLIKDLHQVIYVRKYSNIYV